MAGGSTGRPSAAGRRDESRELQPRRRSAERPVRQGGHQVDQAAVDVEIAGHERPRQSELARRPDDAPQRVA
jgi:hypothetical protein